MQIVEVELLLLLRELYSKLACVEDHTGSWPVDLTSIISKKLIQAILVPVIVAQLFRKRALI